MLAGLLGSSGCAGSARHAPLSVAPGSDRAGVVSGLRGHDYCRPEGPERATETFVRCDRPGLAIGESWVVAEYDTDDRLVRMRRLERQPDQKTATERWNHLVEERTRALGPTSPDAKARLSELGETPDGATSWAAWYDEQGRVVIGVYLVRPPAERDPNVVELIRWSASVEP